MKKLIIIIIIIITLMACTSCVDKYPNEPFNGKVEFSELTLTIPDDYVRDTTVQGYDEGVAKRWEKDNYKSIVTISKHEKYDLTPEAIEQLTYNQQTQMATGEVQSSTIDFLDNIALENTFEVDNGEMKYLIFSTDNYIYEFSVQGDTSDYEQIKNSIILN